MQELWIFLILIYSVDAVKKYTFLRSYQGQQTEKWELKILLLVAPMMIYLGKTKAGLTPLYIKRKEVILSSLLCTADF